MKPLKYIVLSLVFPLTLVKKLIHCSDMKIDTSKSVVPSHYRLLGPSEKLRHRDFYTHRSGIGFNGFVEKNPAGVAGYWAQHNIYRRRHVKTKR